MGVQKYVFSNGVKSIELEYVRNIAGLGLPPVDITSSKGYRQDGVTVHSVEYQARPFTIEFDMRGDTYAAAIAELRALATFFADKGPKTFIYSRSGWTAYLYPVYLAGAYDPDMRELSVIAGSMQFIAANPYFKKDIDYDSVQTEVAVFEIPEAGFEIPEAGIELSTAENKMIKQVDADVLSPAFIRFIGPATTPYVENKTTGERIEVNRTLESGETLIINAETHRVDILDSLGDIHNAFNYIVDGSDFIHLAPGTNEIEFGAAGGSGFIEIGRCEYYASI